MPLKIAAFPKCFIDQIASERSMTVFDWIEQAKSLDADGLEMFEWFFTSLENGYLDTVGEAIRLMLQQHVITPGEFRAAESAPMPRPQDVHLSGVQGQVPYFGEYVKEQLIDRFGAGKVFGSGFRGSICGDRAERVEARRSEAP